MTNRVFEILQYSKDLDNQRILYLSISGSLLFGAVKLFNINAFNIFLSVIQLVGALWFCYLGTIEVARKKRELKQTLEILIDEAEQ